MSQHISRKELKKDEIRDTLAHGAEVALSHQRAIWIIGGTLIGVVLAVVGWRVYTERQTVKAAAALEDAMKTFEARIRAAGEREEPGELTYVDEKNKFLDAAKKFSEAAENYPWTRPGQIARYYAGLSHERLGKHDEAQKWLRELERGGEEELTALARFQLAQIAEKTGKGDEAVKLYRQLIAQPATMLPKPVALLALADYYSKSNPAEATKLYNQIKTDFPNTAIAEQAEERLETLRPKA